jgi:hypothetical protein
LTVTTVKTVESKQVIEDWTIWSWEVVTSFRVQEIEKKRIKDWEGRILQEVEDLKTNFSIWQYIKQIIDRSIIMKELFR